MAQRREPSHPPSDPHPALARGTSGIGFAADDRPVRVQLVAALLLGLVLVASGLYLWRRPSLAPPDGSTPEAASAAALAVSVGDAGAFSLSVDAGAASAVTLSGARVLGCQDRGSKKTPADQCDHLATIEQALQHAIEQAATCVPTAAPGGSIEYVADVSFSRHKVSVALPRAGRSVHDHKAVGACATAIRGAMQGVALDGVDHQHARYRISVTATYRGRS